MSLEENLIDFEGDVNATKSDYVVLTGFGKFRNHESNPSWEAIKNDSFQIDRPSIRLVKRQVDVAYQDVDAAVEELWKTYNPLLMVHVGLAAFETHIRIEARARHGPYVHDDIKKFAAHEHLREYKTDGEGSLEEKTVRHNYTCKPCEFDCSKTKIDVDRLCSRLNEEFAKKNVNIPFKRSEDAGLYLCEYIYQKSLRICDRALFIHVPDVEDFKLEDISASLKLALEFAVDEIRNCQQVGGESKP